MKWTRTKRERTHKKYMKYKGMLVGSNSQKGKETDLAEIARFHFKMAERCGVLACALPFLLMVPLGVR
jgi:hypothetical protein